MSASLLARLMVTAVAAGQGITPLFIDLNRTHATNPLWPGHATLPRRLAHLCTLLYWDCRCGFDLVAIARIAQALLSCCASHSVAHARVLRSDVLSQSLWWNAA